MVQRGGGKDAKAPFLRAAEVGAGAGSNIDGFCEEECRGSFMLMRGCNLCLPRSCLPGFYGYTNRPPSTPQELRAFGPISKINRIKLMAGIATDN